MHFTFDLWFAGGIFKIAPNMFSQVFVIFGSRNGGIHPYLYVLLPSKNQVIYKCYIYTRNIQKIAEIKNVSSGINAGNISVYFEPAILNAFRNEFPGIQIHWCFFHLLQNLKKQIGTIGLMA